MQNKFGQVLILKMGSLICGTTNIHWAQKSCWKIAMEVFSKMTVIGTAEKPEQHKDSLCR